MKKYLVILMAMLLVAAMAFTACGKKEENTETEDQTQTETQTEGSEEQTATVVKTIDGVDEELDSDIPLEITSVTLFDDGSVMIVPTDDLKKNAESNNELKNDAIYPFADSGKAKDIFLVRFGNGGYRTIIALMDDGTLSALSARELIDDQITVVMDNMTGRDNYVTVEQVEYDDGFGVVGKTQTGEEVELDFSLNF